MENLVKTAVEQVLKNKVFNVAKIVKGEFNKVFKVETDKGVVIVRVFRHSHWPEPGKVEWIENQLLKHDILGARILYISRESHYFDNGFMISEFIEGKNGADAILDGDISFELFHEKLAGLLFSIHQISIENYGLVNIGKGEYKTLLEFKLKQLDRYIAKLSSVTNLDNLNLSVLRTKVETKLAKFESKLRPVLVHADATPFNCIFTEDKNIVLIDWDGALSDSWICDYSWLTYSGSHLSQLGSRKERQEKIRKAFARRYPQNDLNPEEMAELEFVYHVLRAAELLPYYYFDQKNMEAFDLTKDRLSELAKAL